MQKSKRLLSILEIRQQEYRELVQELVKILKKDKNVLAAFLYGSVARGDIGPKSDIDILVLADSSPRTLEEKLNKTARVISQDYSKKTGKFIRIEILAMLPKQAIKSQIWRNVLREGKLIHSKGLFFVPAQTAAHNQYSIYTLDMRSMQQSQKSKISLLLHGRTSSFYYKGKKTIKEYSGVLKETKAEILAPACFMVQKKFEKQFEHFLKVNSVKFSKREVVLV